MRYIPFFLAILVLCQLSSKSLAVEFDLILEGEEDFCLDENLAAGTLIVAEVTIYEENKTINLDLKNENDEIIKKYEGSNYYRVAYTPFNDGVYSVCAHNPYSVPLTLSIVFNSGIDAKDYTQFAQKKNFQTIELDVKKVEDLIELMRDQLSVIVANGEEQLAEADKVSSMLILFSFVTAISVMVVASFQTTYLKRFFQRRKMI